MPLFVCTRDGLVRLRRDGRSWAAEPTLKGLDARCVAADDARVLVGTRGRGALLSLDAGGTWERVELPEPDIFSVAIGRADGALYAGTEPSRLFVARDGGSWTELEALQDIPSRDRWSFPPRPWTHHVRWIAPDPHRAERLLVGIELGGLMYSDDGGTTFSDHRPGASATPTAWPGTRRWRDAPTRRRATAPHGAAMAVARGRRPTPAATLATAGRSRSTPTIPSAGTSPRPPVRDAAHAGAPAARGRLYRWDGSWRALPLPADSMPYALAAADEELLVGMADGRILGSADGGERWEEIGVRLGSIVAMA